MNPVSHLGDELRWKHCHDYLDRSRSTVARTQLFLDHLNGQLALLQNHIIGALKVRKGLAQKLGIDADACIKQPQLWLTANLTLAESNGNHLVHLSCSSTE